MDVTYSKIMSLVGIAVFIGICFALSNNRGAIQRRVVGWGLGLQVIFAVLILGIPMIGLPGVLQPLFSLVTDFFNALLTFTQAGTSFLFGSFTGDEHGFVFALAALPTIVFLSSLLGVLYHLGVMQKIVKGFAWIMYKTKRVSGAESLSAAANFSSIAIQVGGIGAMAPDRRGDLAKLGIRSIVGGTLAAFITACIANVFI